MDDRIGPYQIIREIGRGGMGVVYLARDTRLDRDVAIKELPELFAHDPVRLERFEREAKALAALSHVNLAGIYGVEEQDGSKYLVLEYVEGETLADRLDRGPLPLDDALELAVQIAAGVEAAHEAGIIHRDLKPANIKLTPEGKAKVLDFGLARADDPGSTASSFGLDDATMTAAQRTPTIEGTILGTAAYMSPEQARGRRVDKRTDIWSYGVVLYEMLVGASPFHGETASDSIGAVLHKEIDLDLLPPGTPSLVTHVLVRCLERNRDNRYRDIGDVRIELERARTEPLPNTAAAPKRSAILPWAVTAVAALVAVAAFVLPGLRQAPAPGELVRFTVGQPLKGAMFPNNAQLSPDGATLACGGQDADGTFGIWLRDLDTLDSRLIPVQGGDFFWSPDGQSLGFFRDGKLRVVSRRGGETRTVCEAPSNRGASWGKEFIVFAGAQGSLYKVPVEGGTPEPVTKLDESQGETAHRFPCFLPDGETFLYVALPGKSRLLTVFAGNVDGRAPTVVTTALTSPVYAEPGYLLFQRGRKIVAQAFDTRTLTVSGEPVAVDDAPRISESVGKPALSASRTGHIAFMTPDDPRTRLVWLDGTTGEEQETLDVEPDHFAGPALSPDGRNVAIVRIVSPEESDIWILELDRLVMTRFTQGAGKKADPVWSPDGAYIAYSTDAAGPYEIYRKPFTTGGPAEPLVVGPSPFKNPFDWSPDGKYVIYEQLGEGTNMDLWIAPTDGSGEPRPYVASVFQERHAHFSPDGRWVAYMIFDGASNVVVNSFPDPSQPHRVSIDGGDQPLWQQDGKAIFFSGFRDDRGMLERASFQAEPLRTGIPVKIFEYATDLRGGTWTADRRRVLAMRAVAAPRDASATVVLNWARLLENEDR